MTKDEKLKLVQKLKELKRKHGKKLEDKKTFKPLHKPIQEKKEKKKEAPGTAGKKKKKIRMIGPSGGSYVITEGGQKRYVHDEVKKSLENFIKVSEFITKFVRRK